MQWVEQTAKESSNSECEKELNFVQLFTVCTVRTRICKSIAHPTAQFCPSPLQKRWSSFRRQTSTHGAWRVVVSGPYCCSICTLRSTRDLCRDLPWVAQKIVGGKGGGNASFRERVVSSVMICNKVIRCSFVLFRRGFPIEKANIFCFLSCL